MMGIEEQIAEIRKACYGKETRIPITAALAEIKKNLVSKNPDTEKEVHAARGGYETVGKRVAVLEKRLDLTEIYDRLEAAAELLQKKLQG